MDLLLISNEDVCRSRMAQEILLSFGRGLKITTAGLVDGKGVPDVVVEVMEQNGYEVSRRKSVSVGECVSRSWDGVITLCAEAEDELKCLDLKTDCVVRLHFDDPFGRGGAGDEELRERITAVFKEMHRALYELYRDELRERLMPRCSCGANSFCRCE